MQNVTEAPLCRGDCAPLNGISCLACKEAQPNAVYIYCESCINSGVSKLESQAIATPSLEPELQALKNVLKKRKVQFITEEASLERSNCAPLGTICCLACNEAQQQPVYMYCQDCLHDGAGGTTTKNLDLELQALKEVLMRRKSQPNA
ncbi:unnamed protein product [Calypogeia fissa]